MSHAPSGLPLIHDGESVGWADNIGKHDLHRTLHLWVFRLLGTVSLAIAMLAGAEAAPLIEPDPFAETVAVSVVEASVEAPLPLGSLDPESITAPTAGTGEPLLGLSQIALPRQAYLPALRAPPRRPPRLPG